MRLTETERSGPGTRSYVEALRAGGCFEVETAAGRRAGCYPAARTPEEALGAAERHGVDVAGATVWRHLPGSRIGAVLLERAL